MERATYPSSFSTAGKKRKKGGGKDRRECAATAIRKRESAEEGQSRYIVLPFRGEKKDLVSVKKGGGRNYFHPHNLAFGGERKIPFRLKLREPLVKNPHALEGVLTTLSLV